MSTLLDKINERGMKWLLRRLLLELHQPSRPWTRRLLDPISRLRQRLTRRHAQDAPYLRAIWDLEVGGPTFDFATFLIAAKAEAARLGLAGFEVIIAPRYKADLVASDFARIVDAEAYQWRIQWVMIPIAYLCAKCRGVVFARDRSIAMDYIEGHPVFPPLYSRWSLRAFDSRDFYKRLPKTEFDGFRASLKAAKTVARWIKAREISKPIIVLTLRGYGFDPIRDSNIPAWEKLSRYISDIGFCPVVMPDTEVAVDDLSGLHFSGHYFLEGCWNLDLRMAMYEHAFLNLFVPNGPFEIALYSQCRYIMFKVLVEGSPAANAAFLRSRGLDTGQPYPFAQPWQRLVWAEDSYETLVQHVDRFVQDFGPVFLRQDGPAGPTTES